LLLLLLSAVGGGRHVLGHVDMHGLGVGERGAHIGIVLQVRNEGGKVLVRRDGCAVADDAEVPPCSGDGDIHAAEVCQKANLAATV
jgi:hypothetical protein